LCDNAGPEKPALLAQAENSGGSSRDSAPKQREASGAVSRSVSHRATAAAGQVRGAAGLAQIATCCSPSVLVGLPAAHQHGEVTTGGQLGVADP
jgi:hypothetical protein